MHLRTFFGKTLKQKYSYIDSETGELFESDSIHLLYYDPVSLTERSGYKAPLAQVLDFLNAGERLLASRKELYFQSMVEQPDDNGNLDLPVTRRQGYDLIDAFNDMKSINAKYVEYERLVNERKAKQKEEDDKKYQEFLEWKKENMSKSFTDLPLSNENT